ncbi:SGNH hydrolase [Tothia fuscella]|uniref:SGNH hydrolase n=1 Tax=Tothia fuscella TaxID=1048955 RepID=A0A9P4NZQ9_9PEZI|nr:SGNH hydrolase [Tothia fuscella]
MALQMASLGSSYAAGPGLPKGSNYAQIVSKQLNANLADLSVSGSTLLTITSQISKIPNNATIVTITSGGNDLGYVGGLNADSAGNPPKGPLITEEQLVGRFDDAIAKVLDVVPDAKVYLVEYLTVFGPDVKAETTEVPFNATRVAYHQEIAAILQRATERAAEGKAQIKVVHVAYESQNNGLDSAQPWVNGAVGSSTNGAAWHPNAHGMRAVADMVYTSITEAPVKVKL